MKKQISLWCILFVLLTVSVSVSAQTPDTIYFSKSLSIQANGQQVYEAKEGDNVFTAEITNPSVDKAEVTVYAVAYSVENGQKTVLDLNGETKEIMPGKKADFKANLTITKDADLIRFFAFSNGNLSPITKTLAVEFFGTEDDNISVYKINHF